MQSPLLYLINKVNRSSEYTQGALPLGPPLKASGRMKRVWGSELYELRVRKSTPPL